jgi:hypothetical protein
VKKTKEDFENAARDSFSIAEMCRKLGARPSGGNYKILHNAIDMYHLDVSHFRGQGWNIGLKFKPKQSKDLSEILVENSTFQSYKLKNRLFTSGLKEKRCECCGLEQSELVFNSSAVCTIVRSDASFCDTRHPIRYYR